MRREMAIKKGHDPLTGLVMRQGFERLLRLSIATAQRWNRRHAICLLDLNQFSAVNYRCGHVAGDGLLRDIAGVIRRTVPEPASVARLGGDEFGILLNDCPLENARQIAEDVARAIANYRFVWQDTTSHIDAGVGLVEISSQSGSIEDVMRAAESACINAKCRAVPVYFCGMIDAVAARWGRDIQELVRFFLPRCADQSTLRELDDMASDDKKWRNAHDLFGRIRDKTLQASAAHDRRLETQYLFEEICAKTMYNMSGHGPGAGWPAPFDHDSSSWVFPNAVKFAQELGITDLSGVTALRGQVSAHN
jgi:diguanylate cyclase (GGDEF)-like protein